MGNGGKANKMSNQIRVRVKCQSMTQLRQENKSRKEQENEWDRWVKEKKQRIAKLHKIRNKLNKTVNTTENKNQNISAEKMVISVIDKPKNKDGYMKLEEIPSVIGSQVDLNSVEQKPVMDDSCCSCSVM